MGINQLIDQKYKSQAVIKGGDLLFDHQTALKIIEDCQNMDAIIIGMDFWQRRGTNLVEINSTDFGEINSAGINTSPATILAARHLTTDNLPDGADYVCFLLKDSSP